MFNIFHFSNERTSSSAIPRPLTRRQHSTPTTSTSTPINLSTNLFNISKLPRLCTNPFLNGTIETSLTTNAPNSAPPISEQKFDITQNPIRQSISQQQNTNNINNPFIFGPASAPPEHEHYNTNHHFSFSSRNNSKEQYSISEETENDVENDEKSSTSKLLTEEDDVFVEKTTLTLINEKEHQYSNDNSYFFNLLTTLNRDDYSSSKIITQQSRARSLSETEFFTNQNRKIIDSENHTNSNPFVKTKLHKTLSENYLEQYNNGIKLIKNGYKNSMKSENSIKSLGSNCSIENGIVNDDNLVQRAVSCESMTSQSSILLSDLENPAPITTGYLCIGLQYDK